MQMDFDKWEYGPQNMPPKWQIEEWDAEWEDPIQWMEVEKHLERHIYNTHKQFSEVVSDNFRSWFNTEGRYVPQDKWVSIEKERQCNPQFESWKSVRTLVLW